MEIFDVLHGILHDIGRREARKLLPPLERTIEKAQAAADTLGELFASAIKLRLINPEAEPGNLYSRETGTEQLATFNAMARSFPLIRETRRVSNDLLKTGLLNKKQAILLSLGIGSGEQEAGLAGELLHSPRAPRKLIIVGIDRDPESLQKAAETIRGIPHRATEVQFIGIPQGIEDISDNCWRRIRSLGPLSAVNAAFALHHLPLRHNNIDLKNSVLATLHELEPEIVVLSEPDSDHHVCDVVTRFQNAWHHFSLVFRLIDRLNLTVEAKARIKRGFFGREIEDIIGVSNEMARTERHETSEMWLNRLKHAGFTRNYRPVFDGSSVVSIIAAAI